MDELQASSIPIISLLFEARQTTFFALEPETSDSGEEAAFRALLRTNMGGRMNNDCVPVKYPTATALGLLTDQGSKTAVRCKMVNAATCSMCALLQLPCPRC